MILIRRFTQNVLPFEWTFTTGGLSAEGGQKYDDWYGKDAKLTWQRCCMVRYLNILKKRGAFTEPGEYHVLIARHGNKVRIRSHQHLDRHPRDLAEYN